MVHMGSVGADKSEEASKYVVTKGGRNGVWLTAAIIVADVVGAGILAMPSAVALVGAVPSIAMLILMLVANVHMSILMWRVRMFSPGCTQAHTYYDLVTGVFEKAPEWQRKVAVWAVVISQMGVLFGANGLYLLSAGKGLGYVFFDLRICLPAWSLIAILMLLPFACTSRNMGSHAWLVWLNILTLCGTVIIPFIYYMVLGTAELDVGEHESTAHLFAQSWSFSNVITCTSTFAFGMISQLMLTEIIAEMKDPAQLPKAYAWIAAPFQLIAFLLAGVGGYFLFGDRVSGMINENLPFGPAFQAAGACLAVHMLISYLIKGVVLSKAFHRMADSNHSDSTDTSWRSKMGWVASVLLMGALAYLAANVVPFFGDAVNFIGSSLAPFNSWLMPIVMYVRHWYNCEPESRPAVSKFEWACMAGEFLLGCTLLVYGTYTSVEQITADWHSFGYPFDCHCQGMWNTCDCSSSHIGMDVCQAGNLSF
eukprot:TRINITY_DN10978_c0_g1_i1.p1 TRINITY_DN10978_c0_g1~~TRINITY_DN10978_c0_g1_i1.p1  ORF type:complete len:480 (-),score=70.74 TRINITY_DN10978_c0_g1_i1:237-1676(-)